ncbi:helix-turn-helix domain-containing protein [uncultured Gemella sp.]|uniref:helix-turn-helix domain-containing protein n=1 Tax=uncultured Gemella sp. TaxID=254352 RepID=UPI0025E44567|nr:helix-turn-helix transcriptional regulator [uncultured Gemella sp.]
MKTIIDKEAVGARIKQIRMNKGYTLEAFGKLFGAKKGNVQQWEKGRSLPNKERLANISKIADMTVNELLYGSIHEYLENNIDIFFRNNNILNSEMKSFFINDRKAIERAKEKAKSENIDINDIESLNRICNDIIVEIKRRPSKIRDNIAYKSNELNLILYDEIVYHYLKLVDIYSRENNVTKEQAKKELLSKFNEDINKL